MRKAIGVAILVFASVIFLMSAVNEFTRAFFRVKTTPTALQSWWGSDRAGSGDLYGFTSLPQFRVGDTSKMKLPICDTSVKTYNLYAMTDSYTEDIFKNRRFFCGADKVGYAFVNDGESLPVYLDKSKKNILMLECVERNIRTRFADTNYLMRFVSILKEKPVDKKKAAEDGHGFHFSFKLKGNDGDYETNIWDYRLFRPLKELKASITYKWFNRTYNDAKVAPDGKYLLYQVTVDTVTTESSFKSISNTEITALVNNLNKVYDHYKSLGFYEVYVSMIPNPTTILYPQYHGLQYNQLIPKLEADPRLKPKVFDTYRLFKTTPDMDKLFQHSDTHWTNFGRQIWLDKFNKEIGASMGVK